MQHGACDVEAPPWKPWFDSAEEPNILSLLATKLACKNDGGGVSRGCVNERQMTLAEWWELRQIAHP